MSSARFAFFRLTANLDLVRLLQSVSVGILQYRGQAGAEI